jgi:hypothetical protein
MMFAAIGEIGLTWLALAMTQEAIAILILRNKPVIMTKIKRFGNYG